MVHFLEILTIPLHLSFYCPHRGHAVLTAGRVGRLWRKESLLLTRLYRDLPFLQSLQSVELFCKIYKRQIGSRGNFFVVFNVTLNKANYKQNTQRIWRLTATALLNRRHTILRESQFCLPVVACFICRTHALLLKVISGVCISSRNCALVCPCWKKHKSLFFWWEILQRVPMLEKIHWLINHSWLDIDVLSKTLKWN